MKWEHWGSWSPLPVENSYSSTSCLNLFWISDWHIVSHRAMRFLNHVYTNRWNFQEGTVKRQKLTCNLLLFVFVLIVGPAIKLLLNCKSFISKHEKERCNLICCTWFIPTVTFLLLGKKTSKTFNLGHAFKIVLENYCAVHSLATVEFEMFCGWQQISNQSIQVFEATTRLISAFGEDDLLLWTILTGSCFHTYEYIYASTWFHWEIT